MNYLYLQRMDMFQYFNFNFLIYAQEDADLGIPSNTLISDLVDAGIVS